MLTKDKKPEAEGGKKAEEVIPPRPETPKLFKAALFVTEQAGIKGTFAKLKETYPTLEVLTYLAHTSMNKLCQTEKVSSMPESKCIVNYYLNFSLSASAT